MNATRRGFLGGLTASFFTGGCCTANRPRRVGPNEKVNVAVIGCGLIAKGTNVPGFLRDPRCRVTVACDMVRLAPNYYYGSKGSDFGADSFEKGDGTFRADICGSTVIKTIVDRRYGDRSCREVFDWREVIDDPTIDAVCICTPDHWHAIIAIAAMKAGKHVFCQKPMSLSIEEGQTLVRVARETGVTFQVGNQGRNNPGLRLAEELALNGYAGKVLGGTVCIAADCDHWEGHGRSTARAPLPKYFSREAWDLWQGPAEHWEGDAYIPSIHEPTCWRFNNRYGNGMIADFGAHEFDYLQRSLGMDLSGPIAVENMKTDFASGDDRDVFSFAGHFSFDFVYANGVRIHVCNANVKAGLKRQMMLRCEKGDIGCVDEIPVVPSFLKDFRESDLSEHDIRMYRANAGHDGEEWHEADFIDGILELRSCCSPCEVGHRTITLAHLANICERLQVSAVGWDPEKEAFTGPHAEAAEKLRSASYHNGWCLGA